MRKIAPRKPQEEKVIDILKRLAKRMEEATVDIHSIKFGVKRMKLDMSNIESDSAIMKVDIEKMRDEMGEIKGDVTTIKKDVKEIKRDVEGLIETTGFILKKAVTQDEHNALSQRVASLEQS